MNLALYHKPFISKRSDNGPHM